MAHSVLHIAAQSVALPRVVLQFSGDLIELAIVFALLAIVAAVLGARGVAGLSMSIAKWLIILFVVLAIITALV